MILIKIDDQFKDLKEIKDIKPDFFTAKKIIKNNKKY